MKTLELDLGVLTLDQQRSVDDFVLCSKQFCNACVDNYLSIEKELLGAGFIKGLDFTNDHSVEEVTEERSFGYGDSQFSNTQTSLHSKGSVRLLYKYYYSGENRIVQNSSSVGKEGDKLECAAITGSYRALKAVTLLRKLKEKNLRAQVEFRAFNKELTIITETMEKYKELFPKAEVKKDRGSTHYGGRGNRSSYFDTVVIRFESGSHITLRMGYEMGKEYVTNMYDVKVSKMSVEEKVRSLYI